jgi:hypothetical protein
MCRPNAERRAGILYNLPLGTSDLIQQFLTPITQPTSNDSTASGKALHANQ